MAASLNLCSIFIVLLGKIDFNFNDDLAIECFVVCRAGAVPLAGSNNPHPSCSFGKLVHVYIHE